MARVRNDEEESPINQEDILETIFSLVPLIHLAPASRVSKTWRRAISSSLRHVSPAKPWLLVHAQSTRSPYAYTTRAYDPRSRVWMEIKPTRASSSALQSTSSTLLYTLTPSRFSFSVDPLHLSWRHAPSPCVWRVDPVVALVGRRVVVAGGGCDFEDDPLAVEVYDIDTGAWGACSSMPPELRDCAASTWLSVAADDNKMYVSDKVSGTTFSFDPAGSSWRGPYEVRPDRGISSSAIGVVNGRLVLVGLIGDDDEAKSIKMWEVELGDGDMETECREIGEVPRAVAERLRCVTAVGMCSSGGFVYIHNPSSAAGEVAVWEGAAAREGCEWGMVGRVVGGGVMERLVLTCSSVTLVDLQRLLLLKPETELKETRD